MIQETSYHHLYYKLSHNKQYIIHDAQPIFHKPCSNVTNETIQPSKSFVICSTKSQPFFDAKTIHTKQLFAAWRRCDRIYISVFVLQINETKTDTYNEKSTLSSLKSSNFPDTQRCTVTIGSQFYETIRPKVARLCSWKCEIYPMRNGAKLINRRYCEAAGNRDPL